jgi:hypothetical protein
MNTDKAVWETSGVFAPGYPRHSSGPNTIQANRRSRSDLCDALRGASDAGMPGYYSVYSFPRGHSKNDNIPKVDCIFIDLDIEGDEYDPDEDSDDYDVSFQAWRRDMTALLARARMLGDAIIESEVTEAFRVVLSGHKGLHLYLDFPTISPVNGTFREFKAGLKGYGESVMSWLDSAAGGVNIGPWVDVDASDLGRLARHPNTIHHGAKYDTETRWCVPITVEELSELTIQQYLDLTSGPRLPASYRRQPSESAGDKVVQAIRNATTGGQRSAGAASSYSERKVQEYDEGEQGARYDNSDQFVRNDDIEVSDIEFLTANYPCIAAFVNRDDAYDHDNESHLMEINVIGKLAELGVPREVMHEYLSEIPGYSEEKTDEQIDTVLGRTHRSFNCETIADRAPRFCLGPKCAVYRQEGDIQK